MWSTNSLSGSFQHRLYLYQELRPALVPGSDHDFVQDKCKLQMSHIGRIVNPCNISMISVRSSVQHTRTQHNSQSIKSCWLHWRHIWSWHTQAYIMIEVSFFVRPACSMSKPGAIVTMPRSLMQTPLLTSRAAAEVLSLYCQEFVVPSLSLPHQQLAINVRARGPCHDLSIRPSCIVHPGLCRTLFRMSHSRGWRSINLDIDEHSKIGTLPGRRAVWIGL